jgi:hypothetical protein
VGGEILRFDVVRRASDNSRVPAVLRPLPALVLFTVDREVDPISAGETVKVQATSPATAGATSTTATSSNTRGSA